MAGYTRQATFTTGNVVSATDFTNEFDELLAAFNNTSGHAHDGTAAEGPVIGLIGDAGVATPLNKIVIDTSNDRIGVFVDVSGTTTEQVRFQDGAIVPVTDSDVDLGTSSLRFKDLHIDSIAMLTTTVTDILDEDDMTSDSATALATQQSIKAYVDANSGGGGSLTFVGLTDTPSSLSSDGGKMVKVNSGGTALEFVTADTDAIAEGSSNQYHTTARARAAVSVASNAASGGGSLSYDSSTGVFTFTPADVSSGGGSGSVDYAAADDTVTTAPSASGTSAIALGYATTASGSTSVALGHTSTASGASSISIGANSAASSGNSIALGELAIADQSYSAAIGTSANTSADNQLMLGSTSAVTGFTSIRVGNTSYAPSDDYDLTTKTYVDSKISTDIAAATTFIASNGTASAGGTDDIAIGSGANTNTSTESIAIGKNAEAKSSSSTYSVAVGSTSSADSNAVAVGYQSDAGDLSVALGKQTTASGDGSVALGIFAEATHNKSVAIGYSADTTAANQLMLGEASSANGFSSIRVGNTSYAPSNNLDLTPKNYVDTQVATKAALTDLSVTEASASGGGGLAYNSSTGTFTFTPSTSGNRTFVRYSRYNPSVTPFLTFNPSVSPFNIAANQAMFFVGQTPSKDGSSGTGVTVTSGGSGVTATTSIQSDIAGLTSGYIDLTNNSGSTINLTSSGQLAISARLTNRSSASGFAATLGFSMYETSGGNLIAEGNIYPSGGSLSNTNSFISYNFSNASGTVTDQIVYPNSTISWGNGQSLRLVLTTQVDGGGTLSANATDYDFDIEILDFTLMYDSAVSNYSSTTTTSEGVKIVFSAAGSSNYVGLNTSPAAGDNVVGFYEGSSASSTESDYDWSVYAPLPTSNLSNDDVIKYDVASGWTYGQLDTPPTSFSEFAAATKTISSGTFTDVGTLMTLNDGHEGVGEVLVSITRGGYVQALKVTFILTSSGVDFTSYSGINTGSTQYGFIDVAFDSSNGGTAKLQGKVVPGYPCTFTFHVTKL